VVRVDIAWQEFPWDQTVPPAVDPSPWVSDPLKPHWDPVQLGRQLRQTLQPTPFLTLQAMLILAGKRLALLGPQLLVPNMSPTLAFDISLHLPPTGIVSVAQAFVEKAGHDQLAEAAARAATYQESCRNHVNWWARRYPIGPFSPFDKFVILQQAKLRSDVILTAYRGAG
jgi:hypothetical protein